MVGAHKNSVVYNDTSVDKMTTTRHSYPYTIIIKKKKNETAPTPKFSRIADHSLGGNGTRFRQSLRRRKWLPTPEFLPEKSHRQRSMTGYSSWVQKESDTTENTHIHTINYTKFLP